MHTPLVATGRGIFEAFAHIVKDVYISSSGALTAATLIASALTITQSLAPPSQKSQPVPYTQAKVLPPHAANPLTTPPSSPPSQQLTIMTPSLTNGHAPTTSSPTLTFSSIPTAIIAFSRGEFIIVLDSPSRENEGDLIILASALTARKCAFLIHYSSGYLCAPMPCSRADALALAPMLPESANADPNRTAYTVTVDAATGVTTGISARDRALTCRLLADKNTTADMLRRPGHVVPLRAREGGVRERQGHTEAAVEFARLAGKREEECVSVIAELVEEGGAGRDGDKAVAERDGDGMMRRDECLAFGKRFGIPVVTIEDLVKYLEEMEGRD